MSYESDTAARYRAHAEELRAIAESDGLEETRRILIRVAVGYDMMASTMDELDAIHRKQHRSPDGDAEPEKNATVQSWLGASATRRFWADGLVRKAT